MTVYYAEFESNCCLREADNEEEARLYILKEMGLSRGPFRVCRATKDDIAWVAMSL